MPRRARLDAPGTLHHVMVRGIEKRRIVNDVVDRKNFVKRLGELSAGTNTSIYAWALMTNHEHILLRSSEIGLSGFMRRFLTGYAISYNRRHRRWGHLFLSEALAPLAGGKTASPQKCDRAFSQDVVIKYQFRRPVRHTDTHVEWQQVLLTGVTVACGRCFLPID